MNLKKLKIKLVQIVNKNKKKIKKTIVILVLIKKVLITINQLNQIYNFIQLIIQNYINLKE